MNTTQTTIVQITGTVHFMVKDSTVKFARTYTVIPGMTDIFEALRLAARLDTGISSAEMTVSRVELVDYAEVAA